MKKQSGGIEMLLLISCLVGVISFFCISLASSSLLLEPKGEPPHVSECRALTAERAELQDLLRGLELQRAELERQLSERRSLGAQGEAGTGSAPTLEEHLATLGRERDKLQRRIEELRAELQRLGPAPDPGTRDRLAREVTELEAQLARLESKIRDLQAFASERGPAQQVGAEEVRAELTQLQTERGRLEGEVKELRARSLWAGSAVHENPIFVDCRSSVCVVYPQATTLTRAEIERPNALATLAGGKDMIVLFVRPDGYETFSTVFTQAKGLAKPLCYEPVDADQDLTFLKEKRDAR